MATYVLVSGAWHGRWCWSQVVPLLEAAGHEVLAPDLRGMGDDAAAIGEASLAGWADQIAELVAVQAEPVVLVGHSRGGLVISEVPSASRIGWRGWSIFAPFCCGTARRWTSLRGPRTITRGSPPPGPCMPTARPA